MRVRRIPQRTCVGCLEVKGKKELIRVVRTPEGIVEVDPTGKRAGRGAYLCPDTSCLEKAVKGKRLEKALGVEIGGDVLERVRLRLATLSRAGGEAIERKDEGVRACKGDAR